MQHIQLLKQNWLWYLTKSTPVHPSVLNIKSKYDSKTENNSHLKHYMCIFIYAFYVVHVHGDAHDLYLHYRHYQRLMRRNCTWVLKGSITRYTCMLFNTIANSLEILTDSFSTRSAHPDNHLCRYRMSLKQILHDINLIIEINTTHWDIKLIFMNILTSDNIDVGFINLVHIIF